MSEKKLGPIVVIRTILHLTDIKGWKSEEVRPGNFYCGRTYRIRKKMVCSNALLPLGKFPDMDSPFKSMNYEFELEKENLEPIFENYYFKHLYFEER